MKKFIKIFALIFFLIAIVFFISGRSDYKKLYNGYFRLSEREVTELLTNASSTCQSIKDCKLLPGDILIRRHVTEMTQNFDEYLNPYFIHTAVYMGNDEYFEVFGPVTPIENQIQITKFSTSDWLYEGTEKFIVIRPLGDEESINKMLVELKKVADDPEYLFGLPKEGKKETICSDIMVRELQKNGFLTVSQNEPEIISPDYLFFVTIKNQEKFQVVGYN